MLDLASVFDASPNPYMVLDRDLRYVAANRAYLAATGRTWEELIGTRITDAFPHDPDDPANPTARRLTESLRAVFATGMPEVLPLIHYRINDEDRYWSATHTPVFGPNGTVEHVLQHTVDVTAAHRTTHEEASLAVKAGVLARAAVAEERNVELDRSLRDMLALLEQAPMFLAFLRGPEHVFELANAEYRALVNGREVVGRTVREALPEIEPEYFALLDRVYQTGEPFVGRRMPITLTRDGVPTNVFVDFSYQAVLDSDGRPLGVLAVGNEVTARERAIAELEAIFDGFPEALFVGDAKGIHRVNQRAAELLGYSSTRDLQRPYAALVDEVSPRRVDTGEPLAPAETPFGRALRGENVRTELILQHRQTRDDRYIFTSSAPVRTGGALVTMIDVTERRRIETHALQLGRVLGETRDFVGIADLAGTPTFVNEAAIKMMGFAGFAEACSIPFTEYFIEAQRDRVREEVVPAALRDGYWEGELAFRHRVTGEQLPVWYSIFPLRTADGTVNGLATITRDLRPLKEAESERKALLDAERAARAQAERAGILMDQFLATVSHELRTPLTAILGWMQMLRAGTVAPEKRERALEVVERNAHVQAQLVEDLLDVSRIITGKLTVSKEPTDIASVVSSAVETVRPTAVAKGVDLDICVDATALVNGDHGRLQQVVWNLLSNAVKFTPSGGRVTLAVEHRDDEVEIRVIDSGVGIDAEFLPHVFDRFRQADGSSTRRRGGLGLGLSIVRHVVEAHGGTVMVTSEGLGRGSTFVVRLPVLRANRKTLRRNGTPVEETVSLKGVHVLVVDDEDDTREMVRMLLEQSAARVTVARNAADAYSALQKVRPHVLLSDLGMPDEDGFGLIRRVRALPEDRGGRTPAIALTAYARSEDRTRAMLAGFQNHVAKPVVPTELLAVIAALAQR